MSQDTAYVTIPYIYKSRGLNARPIEDQAPEYVYIQLMNILEREENAVSSRFGTQIINRDPLGTGTANHYFSAPVTSLSRLNYQSNAWRYAGLGNGSLQRRAGNGQGAYTQLALPTTWTQRQSFSLASPSVHWLTTASRRASPISSSTIRTLRSRTAAPVIRN